MVHNGVEWQCTDGNCSNYLQEDIENSYSTPKGLSFDNTVAFTADATFVNGMKNCTGEDPAVGTCSALCNGGGEGECNGFTFYCPNHPLMFSGGSCVLEVKPTPLSLSLSLFQIYK